MRTASFGAATGLYVDAYENDKEQFNKVYFNQTLQNNTFIPIEEKQYMGIDNSPKTLVLLIIMPEFLVLFSYLILFWQLLSLYYDGHANLFKSVVTGYGKYFITIIGLMLLITQTTLLYLYYMQDLKASAFIIELIILNFTAPMVFLVLMLSILFKFSGSPLRSAVYSQKLKLL